MPTTASRAFLMASTAMLGSLISGAAMAQADTVYQFDMGSEPLSQALEEFGLKTSRQLIFSQDIVRGQQAPVLRGRYTPNQALSALLEKTDLTFSPDGAGVLMIQKKSSRSASAAPKIILAQAAVSSTASAPAQDSNDIEQVVVSASRITIAGYSQPTPVTVIGAAQLEQDAYANIQDEVSRLPQVSSPGSNLSSNAGGLSAVQGANFLNLRALGNVRTLVLLDGQRVVVSALNNGAVDVTTFPTGLISRVDVVTGGASAAWGSDAVAGVINFVLNKNYTGFKAGVEASDTHDNLRRGLNGNVAWGGDIDGGRGHLEFAGTANILPDEVLITQEHWFKDAYWVSNPAYAAGNGQPQLIVGTNVGLAIATMGGIVTASPAGVSGPGVTPAAANALRGIEFVGAGIPQVVNYGNLTLNTLSNGGSLTVTDSQLPTQQIASPSNTYTFFGYGRYKLTDSIQASVQLNASYFSGKGAAGSAQQTALTIRSDNAYIPASVAATIRAGGIPSFTLGTLDLNNYNNNNATGANFYAQSEGGLGPAVIFIRRNLVRGVFTLDGTLGDDWSWNAYIQDSAVRLSIHAPNNPINANLSNAEDAVTVTSANVGKSGLALGSIACRTTLTGGIVAVGGVNALPNCIPLNVFGTGVATSAAVGYIDGAGTIYSDFAHQSFKQDVMEGSMQGTLPWALPAGKVAVAFGVGYRKEAAFGLAPPGAYGVAGVYALGSTLNNFPSKSYNVIEGFGEVNAPILKNNIVNSLDVTAAGRMTSYSTSGLVETWKLGATSQVNDDIKLRTTWSVDIRAPQLFELFNPGSAAAQTQRDPKSQSTVSILSVTTGNPNALPEVARTVSGGVVLTPTFVPGLSLSADWYSINVTGELTTLAQATILAQCNPALPSVIYPGTNGNPNDPLCKFLVFNGPGGALSQVNLQVINISSQTTSGLDLAANYVMDLWDGTLSLATTDNYNDENTMSNPGSGVNDVAGSAVSNSSGNIGPKWRGVVSANYSTGPYSVTVQSRWWGTFVTQQNGNTGNQASAATANLYDPAHYEIPFYAYLDLRGNYKWNDNISFYGAIDDVLNTPPPLSPALSSSITTGGQIFSTPNTIYDLLGRAFRVGIRINY